MTEINWQQVNDQAKDLFDKKKFSEAVQLFTTKICESTDNHFPYEIAVNYAKCLYYNKQADQALKIFEEVFDEKRKLTHETSIDLALYLNAVGRSDEAFDVLSSLDNQDDPKVKFNLGWHYLRKGEFITGFDNLQHGSKCRAWGNEYQYIEQGILNPEKRWDGRSKGHLLYILEGGLGDQLIFLRWVRNLVMNHNCSVTVACNHQLMRLLINSGYPCISLNEIRHAEYDYYIPAMSYPAIESVWCPDNPERFVELPYIKTHEDAFIHHEISRHIRMHKKSDVRIGIKWFGNPEFEHDQMRTVPKDQLVAIAEKYGTLFSFQFEDEDASIPNMKFIIRDWMDTYTAISAMSVVITSCTSIAHLCGAMGKKCIVLIPFTPYFVWTNDELPWYGDNVVVIRQTEYNNWLGAFETLDKILREIL